MTDREKELERLLREVVDYFNGSPMPTPVRAARAFLASPSAQEVHTHIQSRGDLEREVEQLQAQLAEALGDLAKAREAWAKRGVSRGVVMLHEYDGAAQAMRDALRGPELRALKTVTPPTE